MNNETETKGATAGDDTSGLKQSHLITKELRDAAELEAITRAYDQYVFRGRRRKPGTEWLTDAFIRKVHLDMFSEIWEWAGHYRTSDLNIGIKWHLIAQQIKTLCGDFSYWDSPKSKMSLLEIAARLQNRLTKIHPFKNGNGRHARLLTDIFFHSHEHPLPKWPQIQLMKSGHALRQQYIHAMHSADQEKFEELISFIKAFLD